MTAFPRMVIWTQNRGSVDGIYPSTDSINRFYFIDKTGPAELRSAWCTRSVHVKLQKGRAAVCFSVFRWYEASYKNLIKQMITTIYSKGWSKRENSFQFFSNLKKKKKNWGNPSKA